MLSNNAVFSKKQVRQSFAVAPGLLLDTHLEVLDFVGIVLTVVC